MSYWWNRGFPPVENPLRAFGRSRSFYFTSDLQAIAKRLRLGASPQP
ncbi:hypothetical protein [Scytonema sp. PRP1]